jgi:predicted ATP-grasp superfamily ATP-dependent carboligase
VVARVKASDHVHGAPDVATTSWEDAVDSRLVRAQLGWPPAVIAGAFQTGVLGVRSLKRRGVRTVCFDCNPDNPGFRSVYGPARRCPDPDTHPEEWVAFMIALASSLGDKPALIASSDQFVSAIARHADVLGTLYILSPEARLQGLLADKQTQYGLAAKHGMPMPRTQSVTSVEQVVEFGRSARFPCLVKPTHFREWRRLPVAHPLFDAKIKVVETKEALLDTYRLAAEASPQVVLQELIEGEDSAKRVYLSCYDSKRQRIAHAMFRELRCDPVGFGPASVSEPVTDPEADEICDRFLRSIGYVGICEIEAKRDSRDGRLKLIEANPRLSGGGDAAPYAGVDLCWVHYLDLIGKRVRPISPMGNDFRHIVVRSDAHAAVAYWRAGLISLGDIVRSYRPPLAFFDLDRRDIWYSLQTIAIAGRAVVRGLLRRILPPAAFRWTR